MPGAGEPTPHWNESPLDFTLRHDAEVIRGPVEWSVDVTNESRPGSYQITASG